MELADNFKVASHVNRVYANESWRHVDMDRYARVIETALNKSHNLQPASTPEGQTLLEHLRDYADHFSPRAKLISSPIGLTLSETDRYFNQIPKEDGKYSFEGAIIRIKEQTGYFDSLISQDFIVGTLAGMPHKKMADVWFFNPDSLLFRILSRKAEASYLPQINKVIVPEIRIDSKSAWAALAENGDLNFHGTDIELLEHELTHKKQFKKNYRHMAKNAAHTLIQLPIVIKAMEAASRLDVLQAGELLLLSGAIKTIYNLTERNPTLIQEVHAFQASYDHSSVNPDNMNPWDVIEEVERYPMQSGRLDEIMDAYNAVKALRLLGTDDARIGQLSQSAKFEDGKFVNLWDEVDKQFDKLGIVSSDRPQVLRILFARHQAELTVNRKLAQIISIQELFRESGHVDWKYKDNLLQQLKK